MEQNLKFSLHQFYRKLMDVIIAGLLAVNTTILAYAGIIVAAGVVVVAETRSAYVRFCDCGTTKVGLPNRLGTAWAMS